MASNDHWQWRYLPRIPNYPTHGQAEAISGPSSRVPITKGSCLSCQQYVSDSQPKMLNAMQANKFRNLSD